MTFLIPLAKKEAVPFIRSALYENLYVLPYVQGRLVFSELAVRAIREGHFDTVVVDLPYFLRDRQWIDIPIKFFPLATSLVIELSDTEFRTFNFVPNDAACAALALVRQLQRSGTVINAECIDDSRIITYPMESFHNPRIRLGDDHFALTDGIERYCEPLYAKLESRWPSLSDRHRFFWNCRANIVARRLLNCLKKGEKTLFVCNYRLWWLVNAKLASGDIVDTSIFMTPWSDHHALLVIQNPHFLWARGCLDDYPAAVYQFYKDLQRGQGECRDKREAVEKAFQEAISSAENYAPAGKGTSIRGLATFRQYLTTRLAITGRVTPALTSHLYDAAVACIGKSFADLLARHLLEYPVPELKFERYATITDDSIVFSDIEFEIPDEFQQTFMNTESMMYDYDCDDDYHDSEKKREQLVSLIQPFVKKEESEYLNECIKFNWILEQDHIVHTNANRSIIHSIEKQLREFRTVKSWGAIKGGVDWKKTLSSWATGESSVYIKRMRKGNSRLTNLNFHTPIVYIFQKCDPGLAFMDSVFDINWTATMLHMDNEHLISKSSPKPDHIFSIFRLTVREQPVYNGHIKKGTCAAVLFLHTCKLVSPMRYERAVMKDRKLQCRVHIEMDEDLARFSGEEKLVACGAKYAEEYMIVVACDNWNPSPELGLFIIEKNVHMNRISLQELPPEAIKRLKHYYVVSTSLRKHPHRDAIVARFFPEAFE